jgi:ELWxxDGT repeat protein
MRASCLLFVASVASALAAPGHAVERILELDASSTGEIVESSPALGAVYIWASGNPARLVRTDGTARRTVTVEMEAAEGVTRIVSVADSLFARQKIGSRARLSGLSNGRFVALADRDALPVAWRGEAWFAAEGGLFTFRSGDSGPTLRAQLDEEGGADEPWFAGAEEIFLRRRNPDSTETLVAWDGRRSVVLGEVGAGRDSVLESIDLGKVTVFSISGGGGPRRLWRTDGTPSGTYELHEFRSDAEGAKAIRLGDRAFFFDGGDGDWALWTTDGSAEGTRERERLGGLRSTPGRLWESAGRLYFSLDRPGIGKEPWWTDGESPSALLADIAPGDAGSDPAEFVECRGRTFFVATDPWAGRELWTTDGSDRGTGRVEDFVPGSDSTNPRELTRVGSHLVLATDDGVYGLDPYSQLAEGGDGSCIDGPETLCLEGRRFQVEADWMDFAGRAGRAGAVPLSSESGAFWFFAPDNVEIVVKLLDGVGVNGHHWLFQGALSNVSYRFTVIDTLTLAARRYDNPAGEFVSRSDIEAFADEVEAGSGDPTTSVSRAAAPDRGPRCSSNLTELCLNGVFLVTVEWTDFEGRSGTGIADPFSASSGGFSFFSAENSELFVKLVEGSEVNGHLWLFVGALTNVGFRLTVRNLEDGTTRVYDNPIGRQASFADLETFY